MPDAPFPTTGPSRPLAYALTLGIVALALGLARALEPLAGVGNAYLVFLTGAIVVASRYGFGPALLGSLASVLACNFFFLPPLYTLRIADPANAVALLLFLAVALITSNLAARARDEALAARRRADANEALYAFSRSLADIVTLDELSEAVVWHIASTLALGAVLLLRDDVGAFRIAGRSPEADGIDPLEEQALRIAWDPQNPAPAGQRARLRLGGRLFLPLRTSHGLSGLVGVARAGTVPLLSADEERLLDALLDQAAVAIERVRLADERDQARIAAETERLRSAILASLSHDLKTPLASITGAVTALREYSGLYDEAARDDLAATIQEEAARMTRFVVNLLDMSRLQAGAIALDREPADLGEAVGSALARVEAQLSEHRVAVDLAPDLPMIELDVVLFEQVLVNLLDNAAKYAPDGSTISIVGRRGGDAVTLAIRDEGPGLAPADIPKLFERFTRSAQGDRKRAGTGLGLAICRGFIEAQGGTIEAANRADRSGAVFTLTLPQALYAPAPADLPE